MLIAVNRKPTALDVIHCPAVLAKFQKNLQNGLHHATDCRKRLKLRKVYDKACRGVGNRLLGHRKGGVNDFEKGEGSIYQAVPKLEKFSFPLAFYLK